MSAFPPIPLKVQHGRPLVNIGILLNRRVGFGAVVIVKNDNFLQKGACKSHWNH